MLVGLLASRYKALPDGSDRSLNRYVYYFALPALLLVSLSREPIDQVLRLDYFFGFTAASLVVYFIIYLAGRLISRKSVEESGIQSFAASFANSAYIGIPLLLSLYPGSSEAVIAAVMASLSSNFLIAIVLFKLEFKKAKGQHSVASLAAKISLKVFLNPVILFAFVGISMSAASVTFPQPVTTLLQMLADTTSPVALFAIGMVLGTGSDPQETLVTEIHRKRDLLLINVGKLLLQPALTLVLLSMLNVTGDWLRMGTLLAALPTAATVAVVAEQYNVYRRGAAMTIMATTVMTLFTIPIVEIMLGTWAAGLI